MSHEMLKQVQHDTFDAGLRLNNKTEYKKSKKYIMMYFFVTF